jgi:hypothetical protein
VSFAVLVLVGVVAVGAGGGLAIARRSFAVGLAVSHRSLRAPAKWSAPGDCGAAIEAEEIRNPYADWDTIRAHFEPALVAVGGREFDAGRTSGQHLDEAIEFARAGGKRASAAPSSP